MGKIERFKQNLDQWKPTSRCWISSKNGIDFSISPLQCFDDCLK